MNSTINLGAIFIADGFGAVLTLILLMSSHWRLRDKSKENRLLYYLLLTIFITCLDNPLVSILDGVPGLPSRITMIIGNFWLYSANMITGSCWVAFISYHLNGFISDRQKMLVRITSAIGFIPLVINLFFPIVFRLDENNTYCRMPLYWIYVALLAFYLLDSLLIYATIRRKGGMLKFFPMHYFLVPIALGTCVQSMFYGVSTIWPCIAIASAGIVTSLQNESIFRDRLTGLYNRFYLDDLKKTLESSGHSSLTALMLDLNRFKMINDKFGHQVGDKALCETAELLLKAVGSIGTVIRYAGDEFIILLNARHSDIVYGCISAIHHSFEDFNKTSGNPYSLSVAIGSCPVDLKNHTMDDILHEIDQRMYEDKNLYYQEHHEAK